MNFLWKKSKKGNAYSYLKQNVVTLSSTTLQQHNSNSNNNLTQSQPAPLASQHSQNTGEGASHLSDFSVQSLSTTANGSSSQNVANDADKQSLSSLSRASKSKSFSTMSASARKSSMAENDARSVSGRKSVQTNSSSEKFQFEIVDKPILVKQQTRANRPASAVSNGSNFSLTSPLLNYLQYGDVLIKCVSLNT